MTTSYTPVKDIIEQIEALEAQPMSFLQALEALIPRYPESHGKAGDDSWEHLVGEEVPYETFC